MRARGFGAAMAFLTIVVLASVAPPSAADGLPLDADKAAALALVREGNRLLLGGDPAAALHKFMEAHRLVGGEKLFYNFGQAYRAMPGREVEAYQAFQRYLEGAKTASTDSLASARVEQDEVRKKLALVNVTTAPVGATVSVDGEALGTTPLARRVVLLPGEHQLHVTKDGYQPVVGVLSVAAGQTLDKEVSLIPAAAPAVQVAAAARSSTAPPADSPPISPAPPTLISPTSPADNNTPSVPVYRRLWFWVVVGAIAAGTAAVIVNQSGDTRVTFPCPQGQSCQRL